MRGIGILLVVVVHVLGVDAVHGVRQLFDSGRADLRVAVELVHSFNMAVMLMGSGVAVAAFGRADLGAERVPAQEGEQAAGADAGVGAGAVR